MKFIKIFASMEDQHLLSHLQMDGVRFDVEYHDDFHLRPKIRRRAFERRWLDRIVPYEKQKGYDKVLFFINARRNQKRPIRARRFQHDGVTVVVARLSDDVAEIKPKKILRLFERLLSL